MKQLRIFTSVWGDQHISWFKEACLRSLSWPKNKECLNDANWSFLTKAEHQVEIAKIIQESGIKIKSVEFMDATKVLNENPHSGGAIIKEALTMEASKCLTFNSQMLLAPPDTIFGDGSIANMREIADQRDVCVLAAHVRVTPEMLKVSGPLSNAQLVHESFKHLHKSWAEAEVGHAKANSYIGGVSWRYLDEDLYAVQHRLPTCYIINWTPEDIGYLSRELHWGVWDHSMPSAVWLPSQRQRLIGSSDGAFMAEITPEDVNIPPVEHIREDEVDLFWRNQPHNIQNRMQSLIFRGEPCES